jgi:hypothetical protein
MIGYVDAFEEAGLLMEFIMVLDYVCEELHGLLYEALGGE